MNEYKKCEHWTCEYIWTISKLLHKYDKKGIQYYDHHSFTYIWLTLKYVYIYTIQRGEGAQKKNTYTHKNKRANMYESIYLCNVNIVHRLKKIFEHIDMSNYTYITYIYIYIWVNNNIWNYKTNIRMYIYRLV